MTSPWRVYLLLCGDGTYYCGITTNLEKRMAQHNGLKPGGARYTRGRRPVQVAGVLKCASKSEALKLEQKVKTLPRAQKASFFHMKGQAYA